MDSRKASISLPVFRTARSFRTLAALCTLALAAALVGIAAPPASAGSATATANAAEDGRLSGGIPHSLTAVGDTLFFLTQRETAPARNLCSNELWKSDGTEEGTVMVKDLPRLNCSETPDGLTNVNGTLFFRAGEEGPLGLWRSDGTEDGTVMVKDVGGSSSLMDVGGTLFFPDSSQLWKTDGTEDGTVMVKDITADGSSFLSAVIDVEGTLFFAADHGANGATLWKSDGTEEGTVLVKHLTRAHFLTAVGDTLFFGADDGIHGRELWRSDGTEDGTVMVKDINPGPASSPLGRLTDVAGTLFFTADDGTNGRELWRSDGTEAGTVMVKDINPGPDPSSPSELTDVGGTLFFGANDGTHGHELWKSDGTENGTLMLKDINPDGSSSPTLPVDVGGTAFFTAYDGTDGQLWRSDGTEDGTVMVKGIRASWLTNVADTLFFVADRRELWKSDGTDVGTVMVRDMGGPPQMGIRTIGLGPRLLHDHGVAQGRVRLTEANRPRCVRRAPVRIAWAPLGTNDWRTIRTPRTNMRGLYRARSPILRPDGRPRPGRYSAVAPQFRFFADDGTQVVCISAVSPVRRVPRR